MVGRGSLGEEGWRGGGERGGDEGVMMGVW